MSEASAPARRGPAAPLASPPERRALLEAVRQRLLSASRVVLTTHLNADGDGVGSEAALASFLEARGIRATIVNPTPVPASYAFLVDGLRSWSVGQPEGVAALEEADLIGVLDTDEPHRLGRVAEHVEKSRGVLLDHHPPTGRAIVEPAVRDPSACATGELVYDLLTLEGEPPAEAAAVALYVAIVTDTGSFRFSNATPRAHAVTAELIRAGADPEALYRQLFARYTPEGLALVRLALQTLEVDPELPIAWIDVTYEALRASGARSEDTDGLVEYPRRLEGVEVAIVFRELARDKTKVSLRSNGPVDVAQVARGLGGGGHRKASGLVVSSGMEDARGHVLAAVREAVRVTLKAAGG